MMNINVAQVENSSCIERTVVGLKVCLDLHIGIQSSGCSMVMCNFNLFMKLGVLVLFF